MKEQSNLESIKSTLEKAERWVKRAKTTCIFSYDAGQMLSYRERRRNTSETIDQLCAGHIYKLTNKIRTNKELALFITCLRDLSKFRDDYSFPNVRIIYEPDKQKAIAQAKALEECGYSSFYISDSIMRLCHGCRSAAGVNRRISLVL